MPADQSQTATESAVGALSSLGLTGYEAKCYVALLRLGRGSAREVSEVSTVPRSRVYDATKSLHDRGFVDIEYSNPRTYRPVSLDRALDLIATQRQSHERTLKEAAARLPASDADEETDGVWTVSNRETVRDRESKLLDGATDDVVAFARTGHLRRPFLADLSRTVRRGVDVTLLVDDEAMRGRAAERLPDGAAVEVADGLGSSLGGVDDERGCVARALCVDREAAMVASARENDRTGSTRESAVWSRGTGAGLGFVRLVARILDRAGD